MSETKELKSISNDEFLEMLERQAEFYRKMKEFVESGKTSVDENTLQPVSFAGFDLRGRTFAGKYLPYTTFAHSDLSGAFFYDADLRYAQFMSCKLTKTCFRDASLKGSFWGDAELKQVDFSNAHLINSYFFRAKIIDVQFAGANLNSANFSYATFDESTGDCATIFHQSLLHGAMLPVPITRIDLDGVSVTISESKTIIYNWAFDNEFIVRGHDKVVAAKISEKLPQGLDEWWLLHKGIVRRAVEATIKLSEKKEKGVDDECSRLQD